MTSTSNQTIYLKDYRPTPFMIKHVHLNIILNEDKTEVFSELHIEKNKLQSNEPLVLNGEELVLEELKLDGKELSKGDYSVTDKTLTIKKLPNKCILSSKVQIKPHKNLSLEGLYKSHGTFCTQCEAEGFRRITYYYDRPDILATFQVRIEASKAAYPVLLSNGNCIDRGELNGGRHFTLWEDPHPKPCYLFALVAGQLSEISQEYTTISHKKVKLSIFAKPIDISKCEYALECLAKAFKWDEEEFGLECDLDEYKVVAIGDFNLGAMENKGLNIFNTALVLANPEIARDANYQDILAVIGHEYFHNWTGNRVTCRDWFQLCLKEGLTVYRDQEFSRSLMSPSVTRIEDVKLLKQYQWPEDESPLAHPPRPDRYIEINNFYTSTVYNKGAEVVRMLCGIIGKENFRKGMDLYFEKFDGQAVCQEDFVSSMAEASKHDLSQFMSWYTQAGTPVVEVQESFDERNKTYTLKFKQSTSPQGIQKEHSPKYFPLKMGLLASTGKEIALQLEHEKASQGYERTLIIKDEEQSFKFINIPKKPTPSLFRDFSAAVKVKPFLSNTELQFLMNHDTDPFNVWDSGQRLYTKVMMDLIDSEQKNEKLLIDSNLIESFGHILQKDTFDDAFKAHALSLPSELILAQHFETIDPDAIHSIHKFVSKEVAKAHEKTFLKIYLELQNDEPYLPNKEQIGKRSLKNLCLRYLHLLETKEAKKLVVDQFKKSTNMTDRDAALGLIIHSKFPEKQEYIDQFYEQWSHEDNAIDRWFGLQAACPSEKPQEIILPLLKHKAFKMENPNRMRSVLVNFSRNNPVSFHHLSGFGYKTCSEYVLKLDGINRHMASLLVKSLTSWKKFDKKRQDLILKELQYIAQQKLSSDVYEIVSRSIPS